MEVDGPSRENRPEQGTPAGERGQGQADPEDDPYRRRPDDA